MDAGQAAGILVLLGVVGLLTAIGGSGIAAGPVKFPTIARGRQIPLALASVAVVAGGLAWWAVQRPGSPATPPAVEGVAAPRGTDRTRLRVVLVDDSVPAQRKIAIESEVYDEQGAQLGPVQCVLHWRDDLGPETTTRCALGFVERRAAPGLHHITARAEGTANVIGSGARSLVVDVPAG